MINEILISFCVPVYKTPIDILRRCLVSIIDCGLKRSQYELIVVSDGNSKEYNQLLKSLVEEFNLKLIAYANNMGLFYARKTGIEAAIGKYICHVDSDDYLTKNSFVSFPEFYSKNNTKWDIIQYDFNIIQLALSGEKISESNLKYYDRFAKQGKEIQTNNEVLLQYHDVISLFEFSTFAWSKLVLTSLYNKVFDKLKEYDLRVNLCEDHMYTFLLFTEAHSYKFVTDSFYNYDRTNTSSMISPEVGKLDRDHWDQILSVNNYRRFLFDWFKTHSLPNTKKVEDYLKKKSRRSNSFNSFLHDL